MRRHYAPLPTTSAGPHLGSGVAVTLGTWSNDTLPALVRLPRRFVPAGVPAFSTARGPALGLIAQSAILSVLAATVGLGPAGWVIGMTYGAVVFTALTRGLHRDGARALGPANAVTLTRATLVGAVTALVADAVAGSVARSPAGAPLALLVTLAGVALVLDGVDGYVARRTGTSSALGARFDMETDAFLILVLSVHIAQSVGGWVLAIGGLRYVFVAAARVLPWLRAELPVRMSRKTIAVVQGAALVVASVGAGLVPSAVPVALLGVALGLLLWSFTRDIRWLWVHRDRAAAAVVELSTVVGPRVRAVVRPVIAVGILALLIGKLGTGAVSDALHSIGPATLVAALAINALTTVFSGWRWCLTARGLGVRLPLRQAVADYYQSQLLNATLPGGLVGDVHRAVRHGKDSGDVGRGVRAVVLERAAGQIALVVVGVAVLLAHPRALPAVTGRFTPATGVAAAAAGVALVTAYVVWHRRSARRAVPSRLRRVAGTAVSDVRRGLLARRTLPGIVLSSAVVLVGYVGMFQLAAHTAGLSVPVSNLVPLAVLALLAMTLPLSVGGWGPREGVCAWAFGAAGLGAAQGLTIAVLYGLLTLLASVPGIVVVFVRWSRRFRPVAG